MSIKLMDEWLILSAIKKAKKSFDNWNLERYKNFLNQKLQNAQRTDLNFYLFNTTKGELKDIAEIKKELVILRKEVLVYV